MKRAKNIINSLMSLGIAAYIGFLIGVIVGKRKRVHVYDISDDGVQYITPRDDIDIPVDEETM